MQKQLFLPVILILAMGLGASTGYYCPDASPYLKPLGDIFLHLILTAIVPLIFFSVASAITRAETREKLTKMMTSMIIVFISTGLIASIYMLGIVKLLPPSLGMTTALTQTKLSTPIPLSQQIVAMFTVSDFSQLLNHNNILPLIIFSILIGLAIPKKSQIIDFLYAGEDLMMRVFSLIMVYAPIGFYAYFAVLVTDLGPKIMTTYARVAVIYYLFSFIYFIVAYSFYAFIAGNKTFWRHSIIPMLTALATCSSAASIPANLQAAKNMGVPADIVETTIPLGTILHKEGSIMGGMIKIAFLFGIFHLSFHDPYTLLTAVLVSLLVGTVMGAIRSGGMLGELLILNIYGFPASALISIAAISLIIDPLATMLNVMGNTISSVLIARMVEPEKTS